MRVMLIITLVITSVNLFNISSVNIQEDAPVPVAHGNYQPSNKDIQCCVSLFLSFG